jgi:predicted kinase
MAPDPCLIIFYGLPGTGKTTLARATAAHLKWSHYNTDIIRDQMGKRQMYDRHTKEAVYTQLLECTDADLAAGGGVVLDGTFYRERIRIPYRLLAQKHHIPLKWVEAVADEETVRKRVSLPRPYSEADYKVYQKIKREFEVVKGPGLQVRTDTDDLESNIQKVLAYIAS